MKLLRRKEIREVWADEDGMIGRYKAIWDSDPRLRRLYRDLYADAMSVVATGPVVELGGGAGMIREIFPEVHTSDLLRYPWTSLVCDATRLPFAPRSVGAFLCVGFFHHCMSPRHMFQEVSRTLKPGGRIVVIDPAVTPVARLVSRFATPEGIDLAEPPLEDQRRAQDRPLLEANIARASLLFEKGRSLFEETFPELRIVSVERRNLFRCIAAGSFIHRSPFPFWFYPLSATLDRMLSPLRAWTAMSLRIVVEKTGHTEPT